MPGLEAHGGYTFCGTAALVILGKEHMLDLKALLVRNSHQLTFSQSQAHFLAIQGKQKKQETHSHKAPLLSITCIRLGSSLKAKKKEERCYQRRSQQSLCAEAISF